MSKVILQIKYTTFFLSADRDFISTPITVVLPPSIGVIQVKVPIPIIPDTINEVNQEFAVDLEVVDRPFTSSRSTTTVRIVDNDGKYHYTK